MINMSFAEKYLKLLTDCEIDCKRALSSEITLYEEIFSFDKYHVGDTLERLYEYGIELFFSNGEYCCELEIEWFCNYSFFKNGDDSFEQFLTNTILLENSEYDDLEELFHNLSDDAKEYLANAYVTCLKDYIIRDYKIKYRDLVREHPDLEYVPSFYIETSVTDYYEPSYC